MRQPHRVRSVQARLAAGAAALLAASAIGAVALAAPAVADGPTTFSNTASITIGSPTEVGEVQPAAPYPSAIEVSGMTGAITEVSVTLHGLTHLFVNDMDVLLVAPSGANLVLMSDVGGDILSAGNVDVTLADGGAGFPENGTLPTGTYAPANAATGADVFPAPAPAPSSATTLANAFGSIDPNGAWSLYIVDDATGDDGSIAGGWSVTITTSETAAPTTITASATPNPMLTSEPMELSAQVTSGGQPVTEGDVIFWGPDAGYSAELDDTGNATVSFPSGWSNEGTSPFTVEYEGTDGFLSSSTTFDLVADDPTSVTGNLYCNPPSPGGTQLPAVGVPRAYPLRVFVEDTGGLVTDAQVHINGLSHANVADLDIMLVSPSGEGLVVLSDVGQHSVSDLDLAFSDDGEVIAGPLASGTFVPTNLDGAHDGFPAPAPAPSSATTFADAFAGTDANGTWELYIVDNAPGDAGFLARDWCLELSTGIATEVVLDAPATVVAGEDAEVTATVTADGDPVDAGTVSYAVDGGTPIEAGTPDADGEVTFTLTDLARGNHTITASYTGADEYGDSEAEPIDIMATEATDVTVDAPNAVPLGGDLEVVATVIGVGGDPASSGSLSYSLDGGPLLGLGSPDAEGQVDFTITDLPRGDHTIVVEYVGAAGWTGSVSNAHVVAVQEGTTISLAAPATVAAGDDVDVVATVLSEGGTPVTAGSVSYSVDEGTPVSVGTPDAAGEVAFTIAGLDRGTHTIDATYTGADGWTDAVAIQVEVLAQSPTAIILDAPASAGAGDDVEVTATVTSGGDPVDAGTVAYAVDGGVPINVGTPDEDGVVTVTLSGLARGTHVITADYTGADGWTDSTADPIEVTVVSPTTLEIGIDPASPRAHEPVEVTATLTGDGGTVTDGTVRFTIDGDETEVAAADLATTSVTVTPTSTDEVVVLVEYLGSDTFAPSTDSASVTPTAMPTSTVVTAPPDAVDGDTVTLTADVTADNASVSAAGSVTFSTGSEELGSAPLTAGTATLEVQPPAGALTLTATFEPGAGFVGSTGSAEIEVSPIAAAGGPYAIAEGEGLTLSAAGSSSTATIGWDLDGDGDFSDASGHEVLLTWAELEAFGIDDGPATYPIEVSAAVDGLTELAAGEIEVSNTGPDVIVDGPTAAVVGEPLTLKVSADDPSSADMAELFTYRVDWGDGSPVVEVVGPADPPVTHTYAQAGDVQATFSVVDRDGDGGGSITLTITVAPAAVGPTPHPTDDPTSEDPTGGDPTDAAPGTPSLPDSGVPDGAGLTLAAAIGLLVAGAALALLRRRLTA
ncbi:Ig-like domain repeat protein [Pseudactinotalea sp.]|uniref:Ig-like domain repeat protein n=1 Tax=Pseudactinotalea sp. TaxID=1926260 RepID=UPI003B3AB904